MQLYLQEETLRAEAPPLGLLGEAGADSTPPGQRAVMGSLNQHLQPTKHI